MLVDENGACDHRGGFREGVGAMHLTCVTCKQTVSKSYDVDRTKGDLLAAPGTLMRRD